MEYVEDWHTAQTKDRQQHQHTRRYKNYTHFNSIIGINSDEGRFVWRQLKIRSAFLSFSSSKRLSCLTTFLSSDLIYWCKMWEACRMDGQWLQHLLVSISFLRKEKNVDNIKQQFHKPIITTLIKQKGGVSIRFSSSHTKKEKVLDERRRFAIVTHSQQL